jgi:hypothetical protein
MRAIGLISITLATIVLTTNTWARHCSNVAKVQFRWA